MEHKPHGYPEKNYLEISPLQQYINWEAIFMKTFYLLLILIFAFSSSLIVYAGELEFPKTEDEIVEALSLKDNVTVFEGVTYESKNGKVYKIIGGKRYRLRGLRIIADSEIVPKVGALINFDLNSAEIKPESYSLLDKFGKALNGGLYDAKFLISGHTDSIGSKEYNHKLSVARAQAVVYYLKTIHNIHSIRMIVNGYGESKPIATNETDEGRYNNRRVEFVRME
jgi:outer membrane protein OmpA-like peptidoglycan-associated protein